MDLATHKKCPVEHECDFVLRCVKIRDEFGYRLATLKTVLSLSSSLDTLAELITSENLTLSLSLSLSFPLFLSLYLWSPY